MLIWLNIDQIAGLLYTNQSATYTGSALIKVYIMPPASTWTRLWMPFAGCPSNKPKFTTLAPLGTSAGVFFCTHAISTKISDVGSYVNWHLVWVRHLGQPMIWWCSHFFLSADNLCKQFGIRSGPTKCRAWSRSKQFDTDGIPEIIFWKGWKISRGLSVATLACAAI